MEQRLSIVTLGVRDLETSRRFYLEGLGWEASPAGNEQIVFIRAGGCVLALYGSGALAEDVGVSPEGSGFRCFTLAYNTRTREEVSEILALAERAGGTIVKPAQDVFWGGHSGYFADPDGFLWEVAWNPFFELDENGGVRLP